MKNLAFALVLVCFSVMGEGYFPVTDIEVRVQAKDSVIAQQEAQNSAMLKAFLTVLRKEFDISSVDDSTFTIKEVSSTLCDYSIDKEKFSKTVFIGRFSFRFYRDRVAILLKEHGFDVPLNQYTEEKSRFVVLRSVFEQHTDLFWQNDARIEKFNSEKVVFRMSEENVQKIVAQTQCVKL